MNNIYVIFYFINIFATQIYSVPVPIPAAASVYDVVSANFSKNCPLLSSNVLVNSTIKYLSSCKDISLINPPEHIAAYNINKFYCIGTLVADLQLCNYLSVSKYDYKLLPKNFEELESQITGLQKLHPAGMCLSLKNIGLFNDTTTIPTLSKTITELKQELVGPHCKNLCSNFLNEGKTNELCSMMFYIHSHIANVSFAIAQQKSTVVVSNKPQDLSPAHEAAPAAVNADLPKNNKPLKYDTKTEQQIAHEVNEEKKSKSVVLQQPPVTNNELPAHADNTEVPRGQKSTVVAPSAPEEEVMPPIQPKQQLVPSDSKEKTTKERPAVTLPPAVGDIGGQPSVLDNTPKNDQTSLQTTEGEDQPAQTKNTNETPAEIQTKVNKNIGSVFLDDKDDPPTSTEISNKQNSENIDEYDDDVDVDDGEGLKIDDLKPKAEKSQEDIMISRADVNPNINKVIDDDVEESNFFSYFMFISVMFIAGYVVYHNKQKIMALVLEGRRDRNSRRRPSTSSYRKLNSNLEEAVTSKCSGSASHVIY